MEYDQVKENLREELLKEARESILGFEEQDDVLTAILTGSAASGTPNPDGDLDILLITQGRKGVLYRYLIPGFCPVKRRTELGLIPREEVMRVIDKGYGTLIGCSMIEQLKNGRILFQKDGHGDFLIESSRNVPPGKLVIGELLGDIGKLIGELGEDLDRERLTDAVLKTRQLVRLSIRTLLLAREKTGIAKEKHEYKAVRRFLSEHEVQTYEKLMGVKAVAAEEAQRTVNETIDLMEWVLERCSISPHLVDYYGKRRQAQREAV